jgi:hypothetical protein
MESIESTSGVDVTLCDENTKKMLVIKTKGGGKEEVDIGDSRYGFVIIDLLCGKNEYPRSLKPYLYPDDDWEFSVRRLLKLLAVGDESFMFQNGSVQIIDGKLLNNQEYCFDLNVNDSKDEFTDVRVCEPDEDTQFTFFSIGKSKDTTESWTVNETLRNCSHARVDSLSGCHLPSLLSLFRATESSWKISDVLRSWLDSLVLRIDCSTNRNSTENLR